MRIAYISSPFLADSDLPLLKELSQMAEVDFYIMIGANSRQATLINTSVQPCGGMFPATQYPALQRLSEFIDLGKVYVINMPKGHDWSPKNLKATWLAARFIGKRNYDVVHSTFHFRYGGFPLYMLRRNMVITMHDPIPHSSDLNRLNKLHRWVAFHAADHFIILNRQMREEFIRTCHLERKHIYEASLSIYTHLQSTVPVMPEDSGYVLFTGSINPHKGIEYLCKAMEKVHQKMPDKRLIIAGRGKFWFDMGKYEKQGFVKVINRFVTDEELAGLMRNASVVVCPYIDATQSGVIMSAFALAKPVIATNVGALPEMLEHGRHGLIVPPRDSDALAEAIMTLVDSPEKLALMSNNIHEDYSSGTHSWHSIAQTYVDIYRQVMKGGKQENKK